MGFFLTEWLVLIVGFVVHGQLDRSTDRREPRRVLELAALWLIVGNGVFSLWAVLGHTGPDSVEVATSIGYTPSMFQWEIGWADAALCVLSIACYRPKNRGPWMTATITALAISYTADGVGHIMQLTVHHNTAPDNIWAIPGDFLLPALAASCTVAFRRMNPVMERATSLSARR